MRKGILRWGRLAPWAFVLISAIAAEAWGRGGGGEHYSSGRSSSSSHSGGGDGDGLFWILYLVVRLTARYPHIMCPLLVVTAIGWHFYSKSHNPTTRTQKAFEQREAETRTQVSSRDVEGWGNALKLRDPQFELLPLLDKVKRLFLDLQRRWFERDLGPIRPFLSDATFQRLTTQLTLLARQNVRDAITDVQVLDLQIIGLDQSQWFDTVHVRVRAQMRDADVRADATDEEALAAARRAPVEPFVEVWSFVRKPGAQTKIGADLFQGKCPNCGAPYRGGATNTCEFCNAVVNSGNYDWTLSEITQGIEHVRPYAMVDGLKVARESDPALNLEILEDRTSLLFWRWVESQSIGTARPLAKLALPPFVGALEAELAGLKQRGRRKVFLECAVGGVTARLLRQEDGYDEAHVEVRWSARMGIGPEGEVPPSLPTVPQRWMFVLVRKEGAQTPTGNGMATSRCPHCSAPLTDTASTSCDFCGTPLAAGALDWVLKTARSYEGWNALENQRFAGVTRRESAARGADVVFDVQERHRLLYMMAAMAAADGEVTEAERKLLRLCSDRWSVPWEKVEMALKAGPALFDKLVEKSSAEAEAFLRSLVDMALIDGKVDRAERRMLEAAATHLGLRDKLGTFLARR